MRILRDISRRPKLRRITTIPFVASKRTDPILRKIGARIRRARLTNRLSQEALAHAAGLDRSFLSGVERGEFNVSIVALAKLARILNTRLSTLVDID